MPTFKQCESTVYDLAKHIIEQYPEHEPLARLEVKVDLVFAFADTDDKGRQLNDALTKNGLKALGVTRKLPLKDRAMGRGDAEISLDGDWWTIATQEEQEALLDHELYHLSIKCDSTGHPKYDDLSRPLIEIRKHDVEFGWFKAVANRHGEFSQERQQAKRIMDNAGQYFWPGIAPMVEISTGGVTTGPIPLGAFSKAAALAVKNHKNP
jgi:hypothetical protein